MIDVTVSTRINRPPAVIFDYMSDATNAPAWNPIVLESTKTSDGAIAAGTIFHLKMKPTMGASEAELKLVEYEPNTKLVIAIEFGRMSSVHSGKFEPDGEATIYTEHIQVSMGGGLMGLLEPLFKGMVRKRNTGVLENLKRNLELG